LINGSFWLGATLGAAGAIAFLLPKLMRYSAFSPTPFMTKRASKIANLLKPGPDSEVAKATLETHKFYETRIETIRGRIWTTASWLIAGEGAVLLLAFKEGGIRTESGAVLVIGQPLVVLVLATLAVMLGCWANKTVSDGKHHLDSNAWSSNKVLELDQGGAGQPFLKVISVFFVAAVVVALLLLVIGFVGVADWLGYEASSHIVFKPAAKD
jgi:hypothetical protein